MSFSRSCRNRVHVRQGDVPNLDILVAPFVEELRLANLLRDLLRQGGELLRRLDFDLAVRHVGRLDWAVLLLPATGELVDVEGGSRWVLIGCAAGVGITIALLKFRFRDVGANAKHNSGAAARLLPRHVTDPTLTVRWYQQCLPCLPYPSRCLSLSASPHIFLPPWLCQHHRP